MKELHNITAKDVMRPPVIIDPERTVAHAKNLMKKDNIYCLCICDNNRICGFVRRSGIPSESDTETVGNIMEPCRMSVIARSDLSFIIRLMEEEHLYSLPVMDRGKFVGIITRDSLNEDGFIQ
ncbi:MAG: CBS domain-containing protein [Bacillota bacterium]|nr:CBS domain-containing protein [Bacillota bacterium]